MATRKEYEMLFQLNAQVGGGYNNAFKSAQREVISMQKEIDTLNKVQSDISAYQKQQNAVEATQKKLDVLRQQYDNIQREMKETEGFSASLENKLISKQLQIDKTTSSINQQTQKLQQMADALHTAGVDTASLSQKSAQLGTEIDALKAKQIEAAERAQDFGSTASQAFISVEEAIAAAGIGLALKEIYEEFEACKAASIEFESAMTGVDKTTNLTQSELKEMSEAMKALSTDIPITTTELAAIGEVAGQLGIAKADLLDFSTVMSMLSTATTMTADEAATMLAQFANITRMDPSYYDELASTVVELGNTFATTEQKITEMSQGIAASGSLAGMSEADMLGLSAAVTSLGIETQMGSTSVSKLIADLMTAVETGKDLDTFARVAGMSANQFAEAWGSNAAGALEKFVVGLSDTDRLGASAIVTLTDLGITETRMQRTILSLSNSGDLLTRSIATANNAWEENNALQNEAEKRYATTQSLLTMRSNAYNNLRIAIGDNYTPVLRELYELETDVLGGVTDFVEQNPAAVKAISAFVGVIGVATAALGAYAVAAKVVAAANTLLHATIPGVNVIMGVTLAVAALTAGFVAMSEAVSAEERELRSLTAASREQYYELQDLEKKYQSVCNSMGDTSYEAQILKQELDNATESFDRNKQSAEEMEAAQRGLIEAHNELVSSYDDAVTGIDKEAQSMSNLASRLSELMAVEGKSAGTKEQILTLVEMLNEAIPGLDLVYDKHTDSINRTTDSIQKMASAEAKVKEQQANKEALKKLNAESAALQDSLTKAIENTAAAERELEQARKDAHARGQSSTDTVTGMPYAASAQADPYISELGRWTAAQREAKEMQEEAQAAVDDNVARQNELSAAMGDYADETENSANATVAMRDAMANTTAEVAQLTEAYNKAYEAALESISGQYQLWDKAANVVATDAGAINTALESQIKYWQEYNSNISGLTDRTADIEGLSEMIASFADGSTDSVNAIAGMAGASDEKLSAMVQNWQELQSEQKLVSESLSELTTGFSTEMANLQSELELAIEGMDMSDEAAQSGKDTIQGFINGASDMMPSVYDAYAKLAQAAVAAIDEQLQIKSPSRVLWERGEYAIGGFVGGVEAMEPDVMEAMANTGSAGVEALSASSKPLEAMLFNTAASSSGVGAGAAPNITIAPVYQFSGISSSTEIEQVLSSHNDTLRDLVLEIVANNNYDALRRSYT